MKLKINIRKLLFVVAWCVAGGCMLILLVAAIKQRNSKTCSGYRIEFTGSGSEDGVGMFIDRKDVEKMLKGAGSAQWQGRPILSFDLPHMEMVLEKNAWIRDAQLFFDNTGLLRVTVVERSPVARVFSTEGNSFYIDSSGAALPLSDKLTARLPVFTGYPAQKIRPHGADSLLAAQVRALSGYIRKDPFWMAQIAQVDITPARTFEMAPLVGDQVIEFGDGNDYEQKFHRLYIFYKEVLSRAGFDKYSRIDVQYAGQVIATRRNGEEAKTDSLQGMRNIRQLIRTAQQLQPDTASLQNMRPLERNQQTEQTLTGYDLVPDHGDNAGNADTTHKRH